MQTADRGRERQPRTNLLNIIFCFCARNCNYNRSTTKGHRGLTDINGRRFAVSFRNYYVIPKTRNYQTKSTRFPPFRPAKIPLPAPGTSPSSAQAIRSSRARPRRRHGDKKSDNERRPRPRLMLTIAPRVDLSSLTSSPAPFQPARAIICIRTIVCQPPCDRRRIPHGGG